MKNIRSNNWLLKPVLIGAAFVANANDNNAQAQLIAPTQFFQVDEKVPGQPIRNILRRLSARRSMDLSPQQVQQNVQSLYIANSDNSHQDSLYLTRPAEITVETSYGKVSVKRDYIDIPKPQSSSLNEKQWNEVAILFANEFTDLKNKPQALANKIAEVIDPYIKSDVNWANNPKELYFIYSKGIPADQLGTVKSFFTKYTLDQMKDTNNVFESAVSYLLNDVTSDDLERASGVEAIAHENANIRKFESYLKSKYPNADLKSAWNFAEKYLGIRKFTDYEKDVLKSSRKYLSEGNLYRIDGEFVAKAVINTKELLNIKAIEDPEFRQKELDKFYGGAKKFATIISGSDPVSVAKMGSGLSRLVKLDDEGKLKIFLTVPNESIDFEGELQRPDESMLSFLELIDCADKPLDNLVIFGHGSRQGLKIALDRAEIQKRNPNFFELSDGEIMQAFSSYLHPDATITLQSCSTARPISKDEYELNQKFLQPQRDNIKQFQESIKNQTKYIEETKKAIDALKDISDLKYVERKTKDYENMIHHYETDIEATKVKIAMDEDIMKRNNEFLFKVFAFELAAASKRKVYASSVTIPNLPLTSEGAELGLYTHLITPK